MAVYVDICRDWGWKLGPSCHLYADTNEELHEFAARLGMKRAWFQKGSLPHYDLVVSKREKAVRLGAVEHTDKEMVTHMRAWKALWIAKIKAATTQEEKDRIRADMYR